MTSPKARIGHQFARFRPGAFGCGDIAGAILRFPGKAFAHRVPDDLIAELCQRVTLGGMPCAFDELHHADALAAAQHAQRKTERGRRFSLAGAGMHDQKTLLDRLAGDFGVLHGFAFRHLGAMALGFCLVDGLRSWRVLQSVFHASGKPATMRTTRSARAAMRWLRMPCMSRNRRPSGYPARCRSPPRWQPGRPGAAAAASASSRCCDFLLDIRFGKHEVRQPQRQAIDQHRHRRRKPQAPPRDARGASMVRQFAPRRSRCALMRAAISSSPASAVAT